MTTTTTTTTGTTTPPPMSAESWEAPRARLDAHEHAVVVYDDEEALLAPVAAFVEEGLTREELVVFVHSFPGEDAAWEFLQRARGDAPVLRKNEVIRVSLYRNAFEGDADRIDYAHVGAVIGQLDQLAKERGRTGIRIFVDASRRYFEQARVEEWFAFEAWLGRRLQARVGLVCAYQKRDALHPDIFPVILRTHGHRFGLADDDTQG